MSGKFHVFQDGFVLVGSVAGQRYWSTLLPAADSQEMITCGTWTPDDQQVYLGTSQVMRNLIIGIMIRGKMNSFKS